MKTGRSTTWFIIRMLAALAMSVMGVAMYRPVPGVKEFSIEGWSAFLTGLLMALGMLFIMPLLLIVIGMQVWNPLDDPDRRAIRWHRPTLWDNPFNFKQPMRFFHFGGQLAMTYGLALFIALPWHEDVSGLHAFGLVWGALMTFIALRLCQRVYAAKMAEPETDAPSPPAPNASAE